MDEVSPCRGRECRLLTAASQPKDATNEPSGEQVATAEQHLAPHRVDPHVGKQGCSDEGRIPVGVTLVRRLAARHEPDSEGAREGTTGVNEMETGIESVDPVCRCLGECIAKPALAWEALLSHLAASVKTK